MERSSWGLLITGILLIAFTFFPSCYSLNSSDRPFLMQVDFDGDGVWDASYLADSFETANGRLDMRFDDERYSIEYSSFLATRLDIARDDHEPGPLSDDQTEKLLELSKNKEGSEW